MRDNYIYRLSIDPHVEDWWGILLKQLLMASEHDLNCLESGFDKDDSWSDLCLLMEAADNNDFLRHAYRARGTGVVCVDIDFVTD